MTIHVHDAVEMTEGAGARVRRLLPVPGLMNFDPFVLWDEFHLEGGGGFPSHPHRGFEAVTYVLEGTMRHEDNLGNATTVGAGGAQRFTAGRGLVHSEMPDPETVTRGMQIWINLPRNLKTLAPDYQQADPDAVPEEQVDRGAIRHLVGEGGPVGLHTPTHYRDVRLDTGGEYEVAIPEGWRAIAYVVSGNVTLGDVPMRSGQAALINDETALLARAEAPSQMVVVAAQPHGEPIRQYGPFVD